MWRLMTIFIDTLSFASLCREVVCCASLLSLSWGKFRQNELWEHMGWEHANVRHFAVDNHGWLGSMKKTSGQLQRWIRSPTLCQLTYLRPDFHFSNGAFNVERSNGLHKFRRISCHHLHPKDFEVAELEVCFYDGCSFKMLQLLTAWKVQIVFTDCMIQWYITKV